MPGMDQSLKVHDVEIVGVYDPRHVRERFLKREVVATMDVCEPPRLQVFRAINTDCLRIAGWKVESVPVRPIR